MTNRFPRLFVSNGDRLVKKKPRLQTILWTMIFVLSTSIIPPFSQNVVTAQSESSAESENTYNVLLPTMQTASEQDTVPNGCKDDNGNPVKPLINGEGAWAIILNFNHAPSATETIACLAVVTTMEPEKTVEYDADFRCTIVDNINGVEVGGGKATFDGNFKVECPRYMHETAEGIAYKKFIVHARARFPLAAASYTLIEHSDVHVQVSYAPIENSEQWNATLTSRYGESEFSDTRIVKTITNRRFGLQSTILDGKGTHHINRHAIAERRPVDEFSFDFEEPFQIGGEGAGWVLYNLIIDPPEPEIACC